VRYSPPTGPATPEAEPIGHSSGSILMTRPTTVYAWAFVTAAKNLWRSMVAVASVCASNRLTNLRVLTFRGTGSRWT